MAIKTIDSEETFDAQDIITDLISEELADRMSSLMGSYPGLMPGRGLLDAFTMKLYGSPYQLLSSVDYRFPQINPWVGNEYVRNFLLGGPIVTFKPGMPLYTGGKPSVIKQIAQEMLMGSGADDGGVPVGMQSMLNIFLKNSVFSAGRKLERRLFGFRQTYFRYIQSVNYMARTAALFLGVGTLPVPIHEGNQVSLVPISDVDWGRYRFLSTERYQSPLALLGSFFGGEDGDFNTSSSLSQMESNFIDAIWNVFSGKELQSDINNFVNRPCTVQFMVEPSSFQETFRNETGESMIEQAIAALDTGIGSEIAFITGSKADVGVLGDAMKFIGNEIGNATTKLADIVEPVSGGFVNSLVSGGLRSLKGQKMIYPNIYKKSDVQMNYQFTIRLRSPYGDKYSYFMNILIPLFHLLCLAVPRMVSSNATTSPFLCQCYIPGMCTVNLGIVEDLTIVKNPDGNHVSVDGFPLSMDVTVTVRDLYQAMAISPIDDPISFLYNTTLSEYLANVCGLDPSIATDRKRRAAQMESISDFFNPAAWFSGLVAEPLLDNLSDWFLSTSHV
jgi:hypothetical protein